MITRQQSHLQDPSAGLSSKSAICDRDGTAGHDCQSTNDKTQTSHITCPRLIPTPDLRLSCHQACFSSSPNATSVFGQKWLRSPTGKLMPNRISAAIITKVIYHLESRWCCVSEMLVTGMLGLGNNRTHPKMATMNNSAPPAWSMVS